MGSWRRRVMDWLERRDHARERATSAAITEARSVTSSAHEARKRLDDYRARLAALDAQNETQTAGRR
jgi:hypothetical protein